MGFETMPQIADLEIAATWDEIELEAALRSRAADAPDVPCTEAPAASLADALLAIESLKELPRDERKRRAEELLRRLTSAPPASTQAPASPEPLPADASPSAEPIASAAESAPPGEAPGADATLAVTGESRSSSDVEPGEAPAEVSEPRVAGFPSAVVEPAVAAPTAIADPTPSAPILEPVPEAAQASPPPAISGADVIPKFLTTECAALEPEHPDSLIPLHAAAAAGALFGAVLLIFFGGSREFGLAARPILPASEAAPARAAVPMNSASLAARQGFVALPPDDVTGASSARPYRPPFVGFDFLDDSAGPPIATGSDAAPAALSSALTVRPVSTGEPVALPPPGSDTTALIKRGDDLLKAGDIAAARSAYERAAAGGSAKAQIGVGKTYDPLVLAKLGARGVRGDPVQAASWYARAGEAGDEEGQQRLHALISGLSDCMLGQGTCASRKP